MKIEDLEIECPECIGTNWKPTKYGPVCRCCQGTKKILSDKGLALVKFLQKYYSIEKEFRSHELDYHCNLKAQP